MASPSNATITVELSPTDRELLRELVKALRGPDYGKPVRVPEYPNTPGWPYWPQVWCGTSTTVVDKDTYQTWNDPY